MALPREMFVKVAGAADNTADSYLTWDTTNPHANDLAPGNYEIMTIKPPSAATWLPLTVAAATGSVSPSSGLIGTTFTVTHNGGSSTTLQWELDGSPISGETAATYLSNGSDGAGDLTCVITASAANIGETAAVTITAPPTAHNQVLNIGAITGGLYTTSHGMPTSDRTEGVDDVMFMEFIGYFDNTNQPSTTQAGVSWANSSSATNSLSVTGQTVRSYIATAVVSSAAATLATSGARYYLATGIFDKQLSNTALRHRRDGAELDATNDNGDLTGIFLATLNRMGIGYRPTSTPGLDIAVPVIYVGWGIADSVADVNARHDAIYASGAWVDPLTVGDNGCTVYEALMLTRVDDSVAFNIATHFPGYTAQGSGHAWVSFSSLSLPTLPWQD